MLGTFTDVTYFEWIVAVLVFPRSHLSRKTMRFLKPCDIEGKSEDDRQRALSACRSINARHSITASELELEYRL